METITKELVEQWVQCQMPDLVRDLIRIANIKSVAELENSSCPPYGRGCHDVLDEMLLMGEEYGFETINYDNYVGCILLNRLKEDVGIWAHLDVVEEGDGWVYEPYNAVEKDGYVIGRGVQDNKSSAVIGLYVLRFLKEFQIPVKQNLKLYLGTCEEQGMYDLDYFTKHYPCPNLSLVPDSGFPVCCGERGSFNGTLTSEARFSEDVIDFYTTKISYMIPDEAVLVLADSPKIRETLPSLPKEVAVEECSADDRKQIRLTAKGVLKSAANPFGSKNAMQLLLAAVHDCGLLNSRDDGLFSLCRDINTHYSGTVLDISCEDELSGPSTLACTIGELKEGHLCLTFTSQFPVTKNEVDFAGLSTAAAKRRGFQLEVTRLRPASYFDPDRPEIRLLTETYNDYMGTDTKPFVMSGGTYARKLPNSFAFGTGMPLPPAPAGLFLPGHGDYHQPDEAISTERMRKALIIYILGMLKLLQ